METVTFTSQNAWFSWTNELKRHFSKDVKKVSENMLNITNHEGNVS